MAPPGCKAVIYDAPGDRGTYDKHGTVGYYVGPALKHYRNYTLYISETGGTRTGATVEFFPQHVQMPKTSSEDRLAIAMEDLTAILKEHPKPRAPFERFGNATNDAIRKMQESLSPKADDNSSARVVGNQLPRVDGNQLPRVEQVNRRRSL